LPAGGKRIKEISIFPPEARPPSGEGARPGDHAAAHGARPANEVDALVSSIETLEIDEVVAEAPADAASTASRLRAPTVGVLVKARPSLERIELAGRRPTTRASYAKCPPRRASSRSRYHDTTSAEAFRTCATARSSRQADDVASSSLGSGGLASAGRGVEWIFTRPVRTLWALVVTAWSGRWIVAHGVDRREPGQDLKPFAS